jgi:hypothetical protein
MAISASQVGTGNTLEQFRVQFNNLQTDVSGLESGTTSYSSLSATSASIGALTVTSSLTSVSFILEGDTDDDYETTLAAVDPTADRTVSLPNATTTLVGQDTTLTNKTLTTPVIAEIDSGSTITLDATTDIVLDADGGDIFFKDDGTTFGSATNTSGNLIIKSGTTTALTFSGANVTGAGTYTGGGTMTTGGNIVIPDAGNIGSASDTDAIAIASNGVVTFSQVPAFPNDTVETADIQDNAVTLAKMAGLARGKIIYGDSSGDPAALAVGSANYFLKTDGTDISWAAAPATALDDIGTGDAASTLATSAGNITIDAQGDNTDIIFKGTDGTSDTTFLTLDGSEAGKAIFNAGITIADAGTIGSASDADSIAIASDGVVTMNQIPVFSAGINVSGGSIAGTLSTAAQGNITSLGTLTALTVDDVAINGKVITMTGSTDDTAVFTVATNGALTLETTDTAAAAANIQITADGTFEVDGTTITLDSAGDIVLDADGADVIFKDGGTSILTFTNSSSDAIVTAGVQDKDIIFKGDDGGSAVTALTMDMSAAGKSVFGAAAVGATQTANATGSTTLDFDTYSNFVLTATGNVTLANPSTESAGQTGIIVLIQDGTGSRTLSTGSDFEWPAGTAGTISTAANAVDVIPYVVDGSNSILLGAPQLAFATPS